MPADLTSTLLLILVTAADTVVHLSPYIAAGTVAAAILSRLTWQRLPQLPVQVPRALALPGAALSGVASPLPTLGMVPLVMQLRAGSAPAPVSLAFLLASSLLNPQLFVLTLGALGLPFALTQLGTVLVLSVTLGCLFGARLVPQPAARAASDTPPRGTGPTPTARHGIDVAALVAHISIYFLAGTIAGAALQVLLPQLGLLDWLGTRGWLASPLLGWIAAPFYTCGGSAVPMARSLGQAGFSPGTLLAFLLVGPALRGTTMATLGCLLPRRAVAACLGLLAIAGGLAGLGFDHLVGGL